MWFFNEGMVNLVKLQSLLYALDVGLPVPLGTEGVFTGKEQKAQMVFERFPGNIHNLTW